jgi:hypothetical protein
MSLDRQIRLKYLFQDEPALAEIIRNSPAYETDAFFHCVPLAQELLKGPYQLLSVTLLGGECDPCYQPAMYRIGYIIKGQEIGVLMPVPDESQKITPQMLAEEIEVRVLDAYHDYRRLQL